MINREGGLAVSIKIRNLSVLDPATSLQKKNILEVHLHFHTKWSMVLFISA